MSGRSISRFFPPTKGSAFMGKLETNDYVYFAFKEVYGPVWRIMRKNKNDSTEWLYYTDDSGIVGFQAGWADPTLLDYTIPEDVR